MNSSDGRDVKWAAEKLQEAEALLVCAGAGMGVDSGLPDFRGPQGFWRAYPVLARRGLGFEAIANPSWFDDDPHLAWAFYGHRLNLYRRTEPHMGFTQLRELGMRKRYGCWVFTSNVDGQFQKAGFDPERIVECHGSIHHFQCTTPCGDGIWEAGRESVEVDEASFRALDPLPRCQFCSEVARPNILMFGDWRWAGERTAGQQRRFQLWLSELKAARAKFVVIELGAGEALPTVRRASERLAQELGGALIRINPREIDVPAGHVALMLGAAEGVRRLLE